MPAAPRRCVVATAIMPFDFVYRPASSCSASVIGLPRRDFAEAVTTSMRSKSKASASPSRPGCNMRMKVSLTRMSSLSGPSTDRRHERTVDVAYLFLGVGGQLDERRRMSTAFRLARIVRPLPAARTTVVSATVHVAFLCPAIEDGGPAALGGGEERRAWPLAPFLRSDGQRHAVFECLVEYHRVVDGDFLGRHIWGVLADAPTVRRQPVLPVGQHHWTASQRAVRLPAVTFDPCAHQMPQRGEVDEP